jgi:hypothetical protein
VPGSTVVPSYDLPADLAGNSRRRWAEDVGIAEAISKLGSISVICRLVLRIQDQPTQEVGELVL